MGFFSNLFHPNFLIFFDLKICSYFHFSLLHIKIFLVYKKTKLNAQVDSLYPIKYTI